MVACRSFKDVLELLKKAKLQLSDILQAAEFLDETSMKTVSNMLGYKNPLNKGYPFYALIEVASST
jgi:enamine deaminase RidA (YjgF/YER057c/UK114 family)